MKCPECDIFEEDSRKWQICRGDSNLSNAKVNQYRSHWGMEPLFKEEKKEPAPNEIPELIFHGTSVDDSETRHKLYGPGTELLRIYEAAGVPHCGDCKQLAQDMNDFGVKMCRRNIKNIVNDMLPRAMAWIAENKPWMAKLIPDAIEEVGVRIKLRLDINKAIDAAETTILDRKKKKLNVYTGKAITSGGCCGKRATAAISSKKRVRHREDVSNLILSTAFGPMPSNFDKITEIKDRPFTEKPTCNLLYHIYPVSEHWKWNLDQLMQRIDIFNGRKIVAISVDRRSASPDEVRKYLGKNIYEYLIYKNNKTHGEMMSFVPQLRQLETNDPNQITFRAHAKGVSQKTRKSEHIIDWVEMLYRTNLDDMPMVLDHLQSHAMTGSCRKFGQFFKKEQRPTYSGSFYWFRNCYTYSRIWDEVISLRWGCEDWPGALFQKNETACTFLDNTNSMYSLEYWTKTVEPSYRKWKEQRGINA